MGEGVRLSCSDVMVKTCPGTPQAPSQLSWFLSSFVTFAPFNKDVAMVSMLIYCSSVWKSWIQVKKVKCRTRGQKGINLTPFWVIPTGIPYCAVHNMAAWVYWPTLFENMHRIKVILVWILQIHATYISLCNYHIYYLCIDLVGEYVSAKLLVCVLLDAFSICDPINTYL